MVMSWQRHHLMGQQLHRFMQGVRATPNRHIPHFEQSSRQQNAQESLSRASCRCAKSKLHDRTPTLHFCHQGGWRAGDGGIDFSHNAVSLMPHDKKSAAVHTWGDEDGHCSRLLLLLLTVVVVDFFWPLVTMVI